MPSLPRHVQPSFAAGELSPSLWGRTDLAKYHVGAAKLENFFVHPEGGASNRQGTEFISWLGQPRSASSNRVLTSVWPVPFTYNVENSYLLVFVDRDVISPVRMFVIKKGGEPVLTLAGSGASPTGGSECVSLVDGSSNFWTASGAGANLYYLSGNPDWWAENLDDYQVPSGVFKDVTTSAVTLKKVPVEHVKDISNSWGWGDLDTIGSNTIYVNNATDPDADPADDWEAAFPLYFTTPYTSPTAALSDLRHTQDANTMYLAHPSYPPYELTRSADNVWTFTQMNFAPTIQPPTDLATNFWGNALTGVQETIQYKVSQVDIDTGEESEPTALIEQNVNMPWQPRDRVSIIWNSLKLTGVYKWTNSTTTPGEYYCTTVGDTQPITTEPDRLWEFFGPGRREFNAGTLGSLAAGDWDWGDQDSLGFDTVYIRSNYAVDPDTQLDGFIRWYINDTEFVVYKSSRGYFGYIGTVQAPEFIDNNVDPDISDGPQKSQDPFDSADNYPGAVGIFEQRLCFARTNNQPQTVWASVTGNFNNLSISSPLKDTDSIEATLSARQVNEVRHLVPLSSLLVMTAASEWIMSHGDNTDALTPASVQFRLQGDRGINEVPPLVIGNSVLFAQRNSQTVREMAFDFASDGYSTSDVSVLSQHLFEGKEIRSWAYQQEPYQLVWAVLDDGTLLSFTFVKEQQVWAWARHALARLVPEGNYVGHQPREVAVIPGDTEDEVYVTSIRPGPVGLNVCLEKLSTRTLTKVGEGVFADMAEQYSSRFGVSALKKLNPVQLQLVNTSDVLEVGDHLYLEGFVAPTELNEREVKVIGAPGGLWYELGEPDTGTPIDGTGFDSLQAGASGAAAYLATTVVKELDHLKNLAVVYQYDGTAGTGTVSAQGTLTLPARGYRVTVGLGYTADLETLDMEIASSPIKGRQKATPRASLQLERTSGGKIGSDEGTLKPVRYHSSDIDSTTGMVTAAVETPVQRRWAKAGRLLIRQDEPLPITVAAIASELILDDT